MRLILPILILFSIPLTAVADSTPAESARLEITLDISPIMRMLPVSLSLGELVEGSLVYYFAATGDAKTFKNDLCIFTKADSDMYAITAIGDGEGGAFTVQDKANNTLRYAVHWKDKANKGGSSLVAGSTVADQSGASKNSPNCGGKGNANFAVSFSPIPRALNAGTMSQSSFEGTLVLLVEAE